MALLDRGKHLRAGKIMLAAYFTTEVIWWLLNIFLQTYASLHETWGTFVTDENSAFIPAFELFKVDCDLAESPRHILCIMNKKQISQRNSRYTACLVMSKYVF
jgi:hypothetical protein